MIQKIYKGYRSRKFINIYKLLPDDLQIIINIKLNSFHYYKKHCNSIYKILKKRYNSMNNNINGPHHLNMFNEISVPEFIELFNKHIYPTYCLYNKYFDIVTSTNNFEMLKDLQSLHILSYAIISRVRKICQFIFYDNENTETTKYIYNKMINSIFILNTLSEKYESLDI